MDEVIEYCSENREHRTMQCDVVMRELNLHCALNALQNGYTKRAIIVIRLVRGLTLQQHKLLDGSFGRLHIYSGMKSG